MKTLSSSDKKGILKQLNEQFGISKIPYLLLQFGKEKIRAYSGNLSREELKILDRELRVESIGLYFIKEQEDGIRLSLDAVHLSKNQITKNILEINNEQAEKWLKGEDLDIKTDKSFKILKNQNDFLGCGKSTGEKITNFVPKERRVKN
jgi:NOL1/NOP2/fmu family ribosome biogenesis protein